MAANTRLNWFLILRNWLSLCAGKWRHISFSHSARTQPITASSFASFSSRSFTSYITTSTSSPFTSSSTSSYTNSNQFSPSHTLREHNISQPPPSPPYEINPISSIHVHLYHVYLHHVHLHHLRLHKVHVHHSLLLLPSPFHPCPSFIFPLHLLCLCPPSYSIPGVTQLQCDHHTCIMGTDLLMHW